MTLPDQLTLARALAVPVVVVLFAWNFPNHNYWATAVFVVAMSTDQIDGWLARAGIFGIVMPTRPPTRCS
jgi:CDP-diacylglycerol--glycerol-3-phosphate 3-phosphatidyltransferase